MKYNRRLQYTFDLLWDKDPRTAKEAWDRAKTYLNTENILFSNKRPKDVDEKDFLYITKMLPYTYRYANELMKRLIIIHTNTKNT